MSYPPSSSGGAPLPWAPRGPGDSRPSTWAPAGAQPNGRWAPGGAPANGPATGAWAPTGPATTSGPWAPPAAPAPTGPGPASRPWAPTGWNGGYPSGPPTGGSGGMPPHPPGYRSPAGPHRGGQAPAPTPAPVPPGDRSGRLMSAVVGGLVGAVVAALVAAGLVLVADDDAPSEQATTSTTEAGGGGSTGPTGPALDIQTLLDEVQPTVVSVYTTTAQGQAAGSGFIYDATEGLILTNAHVIAGADEISVVFFDGTPQAAELVGAVPDEDVAMLRVADVSGLQAARLGSSNALRVGDDVVAIGNALGLGGQPSVTTGIVSALNRNIDQFSGLIQTDAAINHGNSGGPLMNSQGQVVGINTAVIEDADNIGLALAMDNILPLIEELRDGEGEVIDAPTLGVAAQPLEGADVDQEVLDEYGITEKTGLLVAEVTGGAEEAGLARGDVIREVDGQVTNTLQELRSVLRQHAAGDTVTVAYDRMGERQEVPVTLGE